MAVNRSLDRKASAVNAISVTINTVNGFEKCRGVYVGTGQSVDFSFDGSTWITFQALAAGNVYPFQVTGARKTSGAAAPTAGDIVFLY